MHLLQSNLKSRGPKRQAVNAGSSGQSPAEEMFSLWSQGNKSIAEPRARAATPPLPLQLWAPAAALPWEQTAQSAMRERKGHEAARRN